MIVGTSTGPALGSARAHRDTLRRLVRLEGPVIIVLVAVAAAESSPRPGLHGTGAWISLAIAAFTAGALGAFGSRRGPPRVHAVCIGLVLAGAVGLVVLQRGGPGVAALFLAVALIARRMPTRVGTAVAVLALVVLIATTGRGSAPEIVKVLTGVVLAGFYVVAVLVQRLVAANDEAERLLVELEASREAHARAAALAERQRLARDMHDVLAHSLSGLVLQLDAARLMDNDDNRLPETIERAHHLAKAGLDEARRAIGMLRDDVLPGPEQLPALTEQFEQHSGIRCEFTVEGQQRELDSQTRLALYRVAQEALTNAAKHAHPERVTVHLAYEPDSARLTVEDHAAAGARAAEPNGSGYGLTGMRERAELLGGNLTTAVTDTGFRVELEVRS